MSASTVSAASPGTIARTPSYGHWIDGRERSAQSGATFQRTNPYDGTVAGIYANGDQSDAGAAIVTARKAFDTGPWPKSAARTRYQVLMKLAQIVTDNARVVAECMTRESGKPVTTGLGEVQGAIKTIEYYAGAALAMEGKAISDRVPDALGMVLREPIGVAGMITPWNFPFLNPVIKIAPAIAAGCTIVVKPSHLCSGPALLVARYLSEAGLPDGVINVVTSDLERGAVVGEVISGSAMVDKIAFTGSTRTGQAVMRSAAATTKPVALELGGKSANIIFNDAPFEQAAATAIGAFCYNSGQQCSAGSRLLVQRGIHDRFMEAVAANARKQVVGDPMKEATTMGPLINEEQHERVLSYIDIGNREGKLIAGGGAPDTAECANGLFVEPTVFDGIDNSGRLAQEEVFGPVLAAIVFDTEEEAIRIANDSRFGLAGGVWSSSISTALRVVRGVRTGKMFVNCYNNSGIDDLPHGGYKESGIGREWGASGLEEFQQLKTVQIKLV